jgi:hypothetical protein
MAFEIFLQCMKHALTQQRKSRPALHDSFEQVELVDLASHLNMRIDQR